MDVSLVLMFFFPVCSSHFLCLFILWNFSVSLFWALHQLHRRVSTSVSENQKIFFEILMYLYMYYINSNATMKYLYYFATTSILFSLETFFCCFSCFISHTNYWAIYRVFSLQTNVAHPTTVYSCLLHETTNTTLMESSCQRCEFCLHVLPGMTGWHCLDPIRLIRWGVAILVTCFMSHDVRWCVLSWYI